MPLTGMLFPRSMWPLLKKDGLGVQYVAILLRWNRLIWHNPFKLRCRSFVGLVSSVAIILLHLLELTVTPPARYPCGIMCLLLSDTSLEHGVLSCDTRTSPPCSTDA
ncbi:hypothetical protein DFH29DRAFT_125933 [Suillus ampliporus]|nr:hypothetical protein DFH29DRAFT_125933 [Suillus ampliporus]